MISFIILAFAPLLIVCFMIESANYEQFISEHGEANRAESRNAARIVEQLNHDTIGMLRALSSIDAVQNMDIANIKPILRNFADAHKSISTIVVCDAQGKQLVKNTGVLVDSRERKYIQDILKGEEYSFSDLIFNKNGGFTCYIVSVPIKNQANERIGILFASISTDSLQYALLDSARNFEGRLYLVDSMGNLLFDGENAVTDMKNVGESEPVKRALRGEASYVTYIEDDGTENIAGYASLKDYHWGMVAESTKKAAIAPIYSHIVKAGAFMLICLVVILFLARIVTRFLMLPLQNIVEKTVLVANGDLTQKIAIDADDEIGSLASSHNDMINRLKKLIYRIQDGAHQVSASSKELNVNSQKVARGSITSSEAVSVVAKNSEQQLEKTQQTAALIHSISQNIQSVTQNMETINEHSQEVTASIDGGAGAIGKAVEQMNNIYKIIQDASMCANTLGEQSNEIGRISDVISDIAAQTNLLALNAAIEAARAGEHGRGFSVVADEIRKLAEKSQESAAEITHLIEIVQQETYKVMCGMNDEIAQAKIGSEVVEKAGRSFNEIAQAIQSTVAEIGRVDDSVKEMEHQRQQIVAMIDKIGEMVKHNSEQTQHISATVEEATASMQEVSAASENLARLAENLTSEVSVFKV